MQNNKKLAIILMLIILSLSTEVTAPSLTQQLTTQDGKGQTTNITNFAVLGTPRYSVYTGEETEINIGLSNAVTLSPLSVMIQKDGLNIGNVYWKNGTRVVNITNYLNGTRNVQQTEEVIVYMPTKSVNYDNRTWVMFMVQKNGTYYYRPETLTLGKTVKYSVIVNQSATYLELDPEVVGITRASYWWDFDQNLSDAQNVLAWTASTGTVAYSTNAKIGNGSLNMTGDVLRITTFPITQTNWSLCMWINMTKAGEANVYWERRTTGQIFYDSLGTGSFGTVGTNFVDTLYFPRNNWNHMCVVMNSSWNTTSGIGRDLLYVNGTLRQNVTSIGNKGQGATIYIGAFYDSGTSARNSGYIDGLGFWRNYTLSSAEVVGIYGNNMTNSSCTPVTTPPAINTNWEINCGFIYNCTGRVDLGTGLLRIIKGSFIAQTGCNLTVYGLQVNKSQGAFSIIRDGTAAMGIKK
jgi:hypothetical protein